MLGMKHALLIITLGSWISARCYGEEIAQVGEAWQLASKNSRYTSFRPTRALEGFEDSSISTWISCCCVGRHVRNSSAILLAPQQKMNTNSKFYLHNDNNVSVDEKLTLPTLSPITLCCTVQEEKMTSAARAQQTTS